MSPKLPQWTAKQLIKFLKKQGFREHSQTGSHLHLVNPVTNKRTTIPCHVGKVIGLGLLNSILDQAGIDKSEII
jgi:predicted RNA binding protein YcfA (HicA-like mRNA interferase family)